jgi:hypothetical protein
MFCDVIRWCRIEIVLMCSYSDGEAMYMT